MHSTQIRASTVMWSVISTDSVIIVGEILKKIRQQHVLNE